MSKINPSQFFDDDDVYEDRRMSREQQTAPKRGRQIERVSQSVADQQDRSESMRFSYHASRHEREWIVNSLGNFYDLHWFSDVLRLIQGGKEASVYLCRADETVTAKYLAAKIYRPRKFRNLKNDHLYREGRGELGADGLALLNGGMQHAMRKRTTFGLELLHASWIAHEVKTLNLLHAAGVDVPRVYASGDNAILMEYIGDENLAAPVLNSLDLERREAQRLFERLLWNIELMLANQRVHGDLSAFNILYWQGSATLIDFPQAISPHENRNAYWIFQRDVRRICEYFSAQGVRCEAAKISRDLWTAQHLKIAPELDPRWLDDANEADMAYWKKSQRKS